MTYMVHCTFPEARGLIALVITPCDSLEPISHPVGRPFFANTLNSYGDGPSGRILTIDVLLISAVHLLQYTGQLIFGTGLSLWIKYE